MLVILQYFLSQPANQIFGPIVSGERIAVGVLMNLKGCIALKPVVIVMEMRTWNMLVSNAGGDATKNKENVTTVVLMDGAVEKIG